MLVCIQSVLLGHPVSFHDGVGKDVTLGGDSNDVPFGTCVVRHFLELKISSSCTQKVVP